MSFVLALRLCVSAFISSASYSTTSRFVISLSVCVMVGAGCGVPASSVVDQADDRAAGDWFEDVTLDVGIDFEHADGRSGECYYIETTASGGGWIDYDADGDLDLYLINGARTPGSKLEGTPRNALFENRDGSFVDVAAQAGVDDTGYGMGMCVGDIDADGLLDFMVTNYGPDRLYRNLGDGRFEEIAGEAGVMEDLWSSNCSFGDVDGDGDLDLYVSHYMDWGYDNHPWCGDRLRNMRAYCRPSILDGLTDSLFINSGDGTFHEEGLLRGLAEGSLEKGFGVVMTDLDNDGDLDIYVANDGTMNRMYINDGSGFFEDNALASGAGLNAAGLAESSMGISLADVDEDGLTDIIMGNYSMETDTLFHNLGGLLFEDVSDVWGVGELTHRTMSWGMALFDADNDGDLDLATARGHTMDNISDFEAGMEYAQRNLLAENIGGGRYRVVPEEESGSGWSEAQVSRGLAVGDFDNDGRLDLVFTNTNALPQLLKNTKTTDEHWLGIHLIGSPENLFAIGSRVTLRLGERILIREVRSGGSFQSQADLRVHFGLGQNEGPVDLEILWPDGVVQREYVEAVDRYVEISRR